MRHSLTHSLTSITFVGFLAALAPAQTENSFWLNKGNPTEPDFNPELGEFHPDIGGYLEFARYLPGHPYYEIRNEIERYFFDLDQLASVLWSQLGVELQPADYQPLGSGTVLRWFLPEGHALNYETFILNGAEVSLEWDQALVEANPTPHLLIFYFPGLGPHSEPKMIERESGYYYPPEGPGPGAPPGWSKPLEPHQAALVAGSYLAYLNQNRWPEFWTALQRGQDLVRFLRDEHGVTFCKVLLHGGSWETATATRAALLGPSWCRGSTVMWWPDFAMETAYGGWTKLLGTFYAALGVGGNLTLTPARSHSVEAFVFGAPTLRACGLGSGVTDPAWEYAAFSILQRKDLPGERLSRPLHGVNGDCDIYSNMHFYRNVLRNDPVLAPFTGQVKFLKLLGHGGAEAGPCNQIDWNTGAEFAELVEDVGTNSAVTNPHITPPADPPADPYLVGPYAHTLIETPSSQDWWDPEWLTTPFIEVDDWVPSTPFDSEPVMEERPLGQGVFPGSFDSLVVEDVDQDGKNEVIFGNFDGFIEVLEEQLVAPNGAYESILIPEHRSPPVGWGVQALDVGALESGSKYIVFGNSAGEIKKIQILSTCIPPYQPPQDFITDDTELGGGFLQWLFIGDFIYASAGNEVLVQNQFFEWFLFSAEGEFKGRTARGPDPNGGPDAFSGGCGKPWVGYWPPRWPIDAMEAFVPGADGRLRTLYYDPNASKLCLDVVSADYHAMGRCAAFWDPTGPAGPFVIVGGLPGALDPDDPLDDGDVITVIDPEEQSIVGHFSKVPGDSGWVDLESPVTIEPYATNEFLVVHGNAVTRMHLIWDPVTGTATTSTVTGPSHRTIPGIADPAPTREDEIFGGKLEICGVERYTAGYPVNAYRWVVTSPRGRIWILNHSDLSTARTTATLDRPSEADPDVYYEWYSNRSFGSTFTVDQRQTTQAVWVDDMGFDYYYVQYEGTQRRVVHLHPATGNIDDGAGRGQSSFGVLGMRINQADGTRSCFGEVGAYNDKPGSELRRYYMYRGTWPVNGYIWEDQGPGTNADFLQNFDVPVDTTWHDEFNGTPWPYAGTPRLHGQVTAALPIGQRPYGNSIKWAELPKTTGSPPEPHVIVGTLGGSVYAVDPDASLIENGLSFFSHDLGWVVIGLDVGDIDLDGIPEILAGTWVDTGDFYEWQAQNLSRSRGQLTILKPPSGPVQYFVENTIELADPPGPFGAGVFGIRIDNIDNQGRPEIWVTDARGYLHALWYDELDQRWECFFRTRGLGMYTGMYNHIYPYKPQTGENALKTTYLVMHTPGYVYRFAVHPDMVPHRSP
ncbi:MAG: hypothetical protein AB1486_22270 [Planctomycetota bacterium]